MKSPARGRSLIQWARSGGASWAKRGVGAAGLLGGALAVVAVVASGLLASSAHGSRPSSNAAPTFSPSFATRPSLSVAVSPLPSATPLAPVVPIVSFWSTQRNVRLADLTLLWAAPADALPEMPYESVAVASQDADSLAMVFGSAPAGRVRVLSPAQVKAAVRASPTTLGLLSPEDVTPDIRALAVDGVSLFGSDRTKDLGRWPLLIRSATITTFEPGSVWTLAAGGDVNLDRSVYLKAVTYGYGPDFPWSAGYAVVSGYEYWGFEGAPVVVARDIGPAGALRRQLSDADLALVNLEGPAPNDFVYHPDGFLFSFDPALLAGLRGAGIDAVSLANNHIRNDGNQGVLDTCYNLNVAGIAHAGAGADTTAARRPAWLEADGLRVAVLAYSAVGWDNWATASSPGAAPLDVDTVTADIHAARAAGADIVIVMPHWGQEYSNWIGADQENAAAAFVAAGADLVIGSHSHWVGAVQSIDRPQGPAFIDYSLGDLLFDLNHDYQSQEGMILTLTFSGTRLVQVDMAPTVMIDRAQVGLMDPAGDGQTVLDAIRRASRGLLDW